MIAQILAAGGRFHVAGETVETLEDVAAYLDAYLRDNDDPRAFTQAMGDVARGLGMSEIARATGLGRQSLYKALGGERAPSIATVARLLAALGLRLAIVPAGAKGADHAA